MNALVFSKPFHGLNALSNNAVIGHVDEFYFDDQTWKIRYLVLDVGSWMAGRKVLISPSALGPIDWHAKGLIVKATREQIEKSPEASTELPVARALESQIHMHYGWDAYWPEAFMGESPLSDEVDSKEHDPHLRSCRVLTGMSVVSNETEFGAIDDFAIETEAWRIPFIVVHRAKPETVLIDTSCVGSINVARREMTVSL